MTFEEVVSTIENKRRFGKACGRDVTVELMKALGNPEDGMHIIHIAGTNGKGSTAAFVSSILRAASFASLEPFKIGTFISPHLIDFTERIMVDGEQIPKEDATRIGEMLLGLDVTLEPTMFDYCLAMAMVHFKECGAKYVVLETGLGGAKDSTSGLRTIPDVCAITSIGLEHTAILGDTIEKIAQEKAGIIRKGTKTVIGKLPDEAVKVIEARCEELGSSLVKAGAVDKTTQLGLFGSYQRNNAGVAVNVIRELDIDVSDEVIAKGLASARWPGRMDVISNNPYILLDGAHNPQGVNALYESLRDAFPNEEFTFIMAVMADKEYDQMAEIIKPVAKRVFTCTVDYSRALQSEALADTLKAKGFDAIAYDDFHLAIEKAKTYKEKIIIFGSLYFIGDVLKDFS